MIEYAIWGKPPGAEDETLLCAMPNGAPITSYDRASCIKDELESVHGCTACRIQTLDGTAPDFVKAVQS